MTVTTHEIGYWAERRSERIAADPTRLVRPEWAGTDRARVVAYLRSGVPTRWYMGHSYCRFGCDAARPRLGCKDLTDGVWIWPEGLPHYIEEHGVALPDEFLAHVRANAFAMPPRLEQTLSAR